MLIRLAKDRGGRVQFAVEGDKHVQRQWAEPEVAAQLREGLGVVWEVVSINTVKTQLKSIYSKLDAHSRAEAIAKARALHLLP